MQHCIIYLPNFKITDFYGESCDHFGDPFINNCGYNAAFEMMDHFYGNLVVGNHVYHKKCTLIYLLIRNYPLFNKCFMKIAKIQIRNFLIFHIRFILNL